VVKVEIESKVSNAVRFIRLFCIQWNKHSYFF